MLFQLLCLLPKFLGSFSPEERFKFINFLDYDTFQDSVSYWQFIIKLIKPHSHNFWNTKDQISSEKIKTIWYWDTCSFIEHDYDQIFSQILFMLINILFSVGWVIILWVIWMAFPRRRNTFYIITIFMAQYY